MVLKGLGQIDAKYRWFSCSKITIELINCVFLFYTKDDVRMIDRITTLTELDEPVHFNDTKEGILANRIVRQLEHPCDKPVRLRFVMKDADLYSIRFK